MHKHPIRWGLVVAACLLSVACQDRREPVKPTVAALAAASTPAEPAGLA
ncbi:hypothetical protein HH212_24225 [Massilia forsythiae]|uniref:Uncharacterized protein n=1 Tax=Massilia forsythiae TaxID=2728020 RepID=A0A7Z2W0X7_9BURK|nr:hypothetical protein [Massilia forsythiae]QJE02730.1 hypothetical protein HH212_24225 [Massilia forsythiae]